jgi:hypothetical protein
MTQSKYCFSLALVACVVLTATASAKKVASTKAPSPKRAEAAGKDAVTLEISGPSDAPAAAAYQKALASSGLAAKVHESKKGGKPLKVMAAVDKSTDLGPMGKAVMTAVRTKPGQMPPGLELIIYAPLTKENSQQAIARLEKVKGVDAKHSTTDLKHGSLRVRISGAEHVTAEEILKAVETAGVVPKLGKEPRTKKKAAAV